MDEWVGGSDFLSDFLGGRWDYRLVFLSGSLYFLFLLLVPLSFCNGSKLLV